MSRSKKKTDIPVESVPGGASAYEINQVRKAEFLAQEESKVADWRTKGRRCVSSAPTDAELQLFFSMLIQYCGNILRACEASGVDRNWVYAERKKKGAFALDFDEAMDQAIDAMEAEAGRRAFEGNVKPIYHQGIIVDHVREYSDSLVPLLLKAHRPEKYKDRIEHSGSQSFDLNHDLMANPALKDFVLEARGELEEVLNAKGRPIPVNGKKKKAVKK